MNATPTSNKQSNGKARRGRAIWWALAWVVLLTAVVVVGRNYIWKDARLRAERQIGAELETAALRVQRALEVERDALALVAHNAATNPRLMAAVAGRVDKATWDDLLANEPWWERYREDLVMGISHEGEALTYEQTPELGTFPWSPLITTARSERTTVPALLIGKAKSAAALGVAISSERFGGPKDSVLVFARILDAKQLGELSEKTGTPLVLSNGENVLAQAGVTGSSAWPELTGVHARKGVVQKAGLALRANELADGLWLWVGTPTRAAKAAARAAAMRSWRFLFGGALALGAAGIIVAAASRRRGRVAPPIADSVPSAPPLEPPLETDYGPGSRLGRYLLVDRIGEGGMAEIFTAVSFGTGGFQRNFVVKRLRDEMVQNPTAMAHFFDEANLASKLVHPNIAQVFDFGQSGGQHYLAQEHVPGRDLGRITRALMSRGAPPLPKEALLFVAHEILAALEYAHELRDLDDLALGIVHRDVTPENIMISERGEVKLLDFGIVKAHRRRASQTEIGQLKGNLDYMSPEQARGHEVDRRSDLFSLGVTLYFCATHTSLYEADTAYEKLLKAAKGPSQAEVEKIAALPAPLDAILLKALAPAVEDRYADATAFKAAVERHVAGGREAIRQILMRLFERDILLERDRLAATRRPRDLPLADDLNVGTDLGLAADR